MDGDAAQERERQQARELAMLRAANMRLTGEAEALATALYEIAGDSYDGPAVRRAYQVLLTTQAGTAVLHERGPVQP